MTDEQQTRPILVFTYGNPSRGDDALGPAMYERLEEQRRAGLLPDVALLTDFQLQIEHAMDLAERERVVFVDASLTATAPYEFYDLSPEQDQSYTTHAMSPAAVLAVYEQVRQQPAPTSYMLSIRGYDFGLGEPLSERARNNLLTAFEFLLRSNILQPEDSLD